VNIGMPATLGEAAIAVADLLALALALAADAHRAATGDVAGVALFILDREVRRCR
jgi:hypothetical protein